MFGLALKLPHRVNVGIDTWNIIVKLTSDEQPLATFFDSEDTYMDITITVYDTSFTSHSGSDH